MDLKKHHMRYRNIHDGRTAGSKWKNNCQTTRKDNGFVF
jgi:hypothetical protein